MPSIKIHCLYLNISFDEKYKLCNSSDCTFPSFLSIRTSYVQVLPLAMCSIYEGNVKSSQQVIKLYAMKMNGETMCGCRHYLRSQQERIINNRLH